MSQSKKECTNCLGLKDRTKDFYADLKSNTMNKDGRIPICKECLWNMVDPNDMETVKNTLKKIDRPHLDFLWESSISNAKTESSIFKIYMKNLQMRQNKQLSWEDSDFESKNDTNRKIVDNIQDSPPKAKFEITEELIAKWGEGYELEEYRSFERKYNMLKNHYQEKTAMHTEALITYIRYRVKEELATSGNKSKEAKEWGTMAKEAATAAKINPSQLSKSDLSDGLDTFGQLVRTVEQAVDIIPILPQFKERPHDKPDFTMWCYINYIRDLKGLPLAEYEEIYKFYEERVKEYEDRFDFLQDGGDE